MRRSYWLALMGLVLAVFAAPAAGQVPTRDSVTGSGTPFATVVSFAISVEGGPSGENPTGSLRVSTDSPFFPEFNFDATATCMNVSGSRATTGFQITSGPNTGAGFLAAFNDGGTAERADQLMWFQFIATAPTTCPPATPQPPGAITAQSFIQPGGVAIVDAPPFPTSKDQCKHGGWRNYGTSFKNEGQCVAFVQRGPKA